MLRIELWLWLWLLMRIMVWLLELEERRLLEERGGEEEGR